MTQKGSGMLIRFHCAAYCLLVKFRETERLEISRLSSDMHSSVGADMRYSDEHS